MKKPLSPLPAHPEVIFENVKLAGASDRVAEIQGGQIGIAEVAVHLARANVPPASPVVPPASLVDELQP